MFTYPAICDVTVETLDFLTGLVHRHCKNHDRRPAQCAGTARTQAKLVLWWLVLCRVSWRRVSQLGSTTETGSQALTATWERPDLVLSAPAAPFGHRSCSVSL